MREKMVITIARSYGSGGKEIGEKLARELNFSFYDKDLIRLAADKSGLNEELLESADEQILNRLIDPYALTGGMTDNTNDQLYRIESQIIRDLAEKGSCVIVGRLADWVLRDRPDVLDIYITAPLQDRIRRIMETQNLNESQAKKLVKRMDKTRRGYYSYFTEWEWNGTEGRDIIINSSLKGIDGTVALLKSIADSF